MTLDKLKKTKWYAVQKDEKDPDWEEALQYALRDNLMVRVVFERGCLMPPLEWSILVCNMDFSMSAHKTKQAALTMCKKMGWRVMCTCDS